MRKNYISKNILINVKIENGRTLVLPSQEYLFTNYLYR